jgi:hypothetical protein
MNKTQDHEDPVEKSKDGNSSLPPTKGKKFFSSKFSTGVRFTFAGE